MHSINRRLGIRNSSSAAGDRSLVRSHSGRSRSFSLVVASILLLFCCLSSSWAARPGHKKAKAYGQGFSIEIPSPESEVLQAVDAIINNGIIQGSKEYNKDQYIEHATPATFSSLFPNWKEPGKVFYKVRTKVLSPLNFSESRDEGTLAVRYVVQSKDSSRTILRIDAVFVEDFRHTVHPSDGNVEISEYKDIQDHVDTIELQKKQAEEGEKKRQEELAKQILERKGEADETSALATAQASAQALEQHVQDLRRKAERVVKAPGAQLKSAPFHSATSLKSLDAGVEVVILIVTPYWYGVETEDRQHGWINRAQLEPIP